MQYDPKTDQKHVFTLPDMIQLRHALEQIPPSKEIQEARKIIDKGILEIVKSLTLPTNKETVQ